jgi:nicotinate dehydrogenase subunit A
VDFVVNGRPVQLELDPETPLLYVLRNDLGLLGTRFGCGSGSCGACMVLVDGQPTPSCDLPLWSVAGKSVVTVEGLGDPHGLQTASVEGLGDPHGLQTAFVEEQAAQCGYCLSGILVNAAALLEREPRPTEQAVRTQLDRNLCRCGVHNRVVRAVLRAAESA